MPRQTTADRYRVFGDWAHPVSPPYAQLALAVADDAELLRHLDALPPEKRQPNLLFGAVRYLGGPVEPPERSVRWMRQHWPSLVEVMWRRRTQTNEPGRCAVLLPLLAQLPQPLALVEVGASAGLCLYPDAYRYRYGAHTVGPQDSPVELACTPTGQPPLPDRVPEVAWRAGLDLEPVDLTDDEDLRWLDALIWPGNHRRSAQLHAAAEIVRADPPLIQRGDLVHDLPDLVAQAPGHATLVVFHTAVLIYVSESGRSAFTAAVQQLPGHWISNEPPEVLPAIGAATPRSDGTDQHFVLAQDGRPAALTAPHGQWLHWLDSDEHAG